MKTTIIQTGIIISFLLLSACEEQLDVDVKSNDLPTTTQEVAVPADLPVAIYSNACYREGEVLTVYNPKTQDFQAYSSSDYIVKWIAEGEIINQGVSIQCVCNKKLTIDVTEISTGFNNTLEYQATKCHDE
ncbi:MAG: hypothetical protein H6577_21190 [Lewinellaceae bacterium]|nr:hypothetical protein [Lewinellaceae bacterium]